MMADPGLRYHNSNADNCVPTSRPAATKGAKPGKKAASVNPENTRQKVTEVVNVTNKNPSIDKGAPSVEPKTARVGNGWSHELNDKVSLQPDLNSNDIDLKRKKRKLDDEICDKSGMPTKIDNPSPTTDGKSGGTEMTNEGENGEDSQSEVAQNSTESPKQPPSGGSGSFMAGSLVLSNSILDEVLNEKKMSILQSPEVVEFLQLAQLKRKSVKPELP